MSDPIETGFPSLPSATGDLRARDARRARRWRLVVLGGIGILGALLVAGWAIRPAPPEAPLLPRMIIEVPGMH